MLLRGSLAPRGQPQPCAAKGAWMVGSESASLEKGLLRSLGPSTAPALLPTHTSARWHLPWPQASPSTLQERTNPRGTGQINPKSRFQERISSSVVLS